MEWKQKQLYNRQLHRFVRQALNGIYMVQLARYILRNRLHCKFSLFWKLYIIFMYNKYKNLYIVIQNIFIIITWAVCYSCVYHCMINKFNLVHMYFAVLLLLLLRNLFTNFPATFNSYYRTTIEYREIKESTSGLCRRFAGLD